MKDWIFLIRQGHVWGHIEDTFKPSNFFLFIHFYSLEHILTVEYLIFIHTINITKNQMILVMSCFVVLKRRNWFELRIYSGSDWAQCEGGDYQNLVFKHLYRDRQIHKPQVPRIRGLKVAFSCQQQAEERNFFTSFSQNLGFVDLPIPVDW